MLFNSLAYVVFFPTVVTLYFLTPHRFRWALLLFASYVFYGWWELNYLVLIFASTLIDYVAGRMMGRYEDQERRKPWLMVSLLSNLGILIGFKYFNFFSGSIGGLMQAYGFDAELPRLEFLLPVGISFYTFQTLAYSIDVYRGRQEPERHLGIFALYVSFFPQLVAGPIERSQNLLPQFHAKRDFNYDRAVDGCRLIVWGLFKKMVIADRLAMYVDHVYNQPGEFQGVPIIIATYFFAIQIYCDFSGYSDIAIGSAKIMGYDLMTNFRQPYFSRSIKEFWSRWHISLSTWFRDYLYIPLGGNRVSRRRWLTNLMIVFVVSGLWHGAAWTFVIWGAIHGTLLVGAELTRSTRERGWEVVQSWFGPRGTLESGTTTTGFVARVRDLLALFITFHLVLVSWVFFRADSVGTALQLIRDAFIIRGLEINVTLGRYGLLVAGLSIILLFTVEYLQRHKPLGRIVRAQPTWVRWPVYAAGVLLVLLFGEYGATAFIYFQF